MVALIVLRGACAMLRRPDHADDLQTEGFRNFVRKFYHLMVEYAHLTRVTYITDITRVTYITRQQPVTIITIITTTATPPR